MASEVARYGAVQRLRVGSNSGCEEAGNIGSSWPLPHGLRPRPKLGLRTEKYCFLNVEAGPNGRSAGTLSWGGLFNTYYWLDPERKVTGLIMTQVLPFADPRVLKLYGRFESSV